LEVLHNSIQTFLDVQGALPFTMDIVFDVEGAKKGCGGGVHAWREYMIFV
jgi:hypothetical protein